MNKIINLLSTRLATIIIIVIAILSRIVNVLFVSYAGRDKMFLVMQSKSLLSGKGLGVPEYFTYNTITPAYDYTPLWPPGYSFLLAPFLKLFNYDVYWATTSFDIVTCIALIFVLRKLCKQINLPIAGTNIITLIAGCFEYTFINESLPTDTISVVLFIIGFIVTLQFLNQKSFSYKTLIAASFLMFLPCLFRYNYPAISMAAVSSVLFTGIMKNDGLLKKKGSWLFLLTVLFTGVFFAIMKLSTGHFSYAMPTERGVFTGNVVHWFPFSASAFINIAFLTSQVIRLTGIPFNITMQWLEVINILVVVPLLLYFVFFIFRKKSFEQISTIKLFIIIGSASCIGLLVVLGYASLTYKIQEGLINNWNYIYEPRYFAIAVVFFQLLFISWYFFKFRIGVQKNIITNVFVTCVFLLLFIEITHNIYFHTKVAFRFREYKESVFREKDFAYYNSLIRDIDKKFPGYEIWVSAPGDNFYQYMATYLGYKGIADARSFTSTRPAVNHKTLLLLMLYDHEIPRYQKLLSENKILLSHHVNYSNFYAVEILP